MARFLRIDFLKGTLFVLGILRGGDSASLETGDTRCTPCQGVDKHLARWEGQDAQVWSFAARGDLPLLAACWGRRALATSGSLTLVAIVGVGQRDARETVPVEKEHGGDVASLGQRGQQGAAACARGGFWYLSGCAWAPGGGWDAWGREVASGCVGGLYAGGDRQRYSIALAEGACSAK
ncbi:hypothetical protein BDZ91DRAFT_759406 [Kalaharituber pfeilii]|nr:hypothetical protein BDZ91DRAFT_759406 [Kalaharituber pfeilii]